MTRQEILAVAKPILFNADMVRAILDGRKTATRRMVKAPYYIDNADVCKRSGTAMHKGTNGTHGMPYPDSPCQPGDYLYVRETWAAWSPTYGIAPKLYYKADNGTPTGIKWHPSIHMPKEAARIFLRVTAVRAERLQDITEEQAQAEGAELLSTPNCPGNGRIYLQGFAETWDACYASPRPVKRNGIITHYESYPWADIREPRTHKGLRWEVYGNPWVWVIELERIEVDSNG